MEINFDFHAKKNFLLYIAKALCYNYKNTPNGRKNFLPSI